MKYKLMLSSMTGEVSGIIKLTGENLLYIPLAEDNTDYQEYLKWLEEGNTPLPADSE